MESLRVPRFVIQKPVAEDCGFIQLAGFAQAHDNLENLRG
jgi:hypothetical protein